MSEWISVNIPFGPLYARDGDFEELDSFTKRKLNKVGTLVQMKGGKKYLIGSINCLRGVCDDCTAFGTKDQVKKYKVFVFEEDIED